MDVRKLSRDAEFMTWKRLVMCVVYEVLAEDEGRWRFPTVFASVTFPCEPVVRVNHCPFLGFVYSALHERSHDFKWCFGVLPLQSHSLSFFHSCFGVRACVSVYVLSLLFFSCNQWFPFEIIIKYTHARPHPLSFPLIPNIYLIGWGMNYGRGSITTSQRDVFIRSRSYACVRNQVDTGY